MTHGIGESLDEVRKSLIYSLSIVTLSLILYILKVPVEQIVSVAIFTSVVMGTLFFWRYRLAFALIGVSALLGLGLIDVETLLEFAGLDIIVFLIATMILVGFLEERRFFEYVVYKLTPVIGSASRLIILLMILSALFAALVGEVTSILFMMSIMLHMLSRYNIDPIPLMMMLVFATNVGSSATLVGNPVGIMIAFRAGLSFTDFLRWATPISIFTLMLTIFLSLRYFRYYVDTLDEAIRKDIAKFGNAGQEETNFKGIWYSFVLFIGVLALLIFHSQIEAILGLKKNSMLIGAVLLGAGISLVLEKERAREIVEMRVDWWTLLFFMFFFAVVGTLKYTGITKALAKGLVSMTKGDWPLLYVSVTMISALMSAFMDNVLAVATFIPLIHELRAIGGINTYPFWWVLLFSGTLFGNLTMIGSTANIVAVGMLERGRMGHVSFLEWLKAGLYVAVPTLIIAVILVYLQIPLM